jgi:nucleotide-binding universal stress UspA family protein
MRILIGVDDSPFSEAAVEFVRTMSWPRGSAAIVVTAVRPAVPVYSEIYVPAAPPSPELLGEQTQAAQELVSNAERSLQGAGLTTEARVLDGDPREALVELVKTERADLLVVGSHGRTGLAKLLMGSVAAHVLAHAPCTVIVVKKPRAN